MKVDYKQIQKWIVQPVLIGVVTVGAIAYQPEVSFASHGAIAASKSTPKPVSPNQAIYRSDVPPNNVGGSRTKLLPPGWKILL